MPNAPDPGAVADQSGGAPSSPTSTGAPVLRPAGGYTGLAPGAILASRFRIVSLLGRGGMGEVYRAEDLKLGQPVALKFLPGPIDQSRLERFYAEVRLGRQVAHPNVCRIYDVIEADGRHFLVMEYVDGEDLASLLRRIGRLPQDKATEIARGLCAGLAAAHEKGILHRDLKPANVMIDGRGHARLTDFGLAALAGEATKDVRAGTPAYMAPEQLHGEGPSVRSDLYSLGLVFYEIFTGRRAWDAGSIAELLKLRSGPSPTTPSSLVKDLDPAIERLILRCLERDPTARPATAHALLAAFPGGDPLQAAIALGETPSPEMVAAASQVGDLRPAAAWACLALVIVGLLAAGVLSRWTAAYRHVPFEKPPEVMVERARQIVRLAGVVAAPGDWAGWYEYSNQQQLYCGLTEVCFVYRQSAPLDPGTGMPQYLLPGSGVVRRGDPALRTPGMVSLELTTEGRLTRFSVVPPSFDDDPTIPSPPDWSPFLREAGFDLAELTQAAAQWTPPIASDRRTAWLVKERDRPDGAARVEAASFRDRPVDFRVLWRWDKPAENIRWQEYPFFHRIFGWWGINPLSNMVVLAAGLILARHNLRTGRSDAVGALRTAVFFLVARVLASVLTGHHVASPLPESWIFEKPLAGDLWDAARVWLLYVALEPYARRRWPHTLISWNRLVIGRLRDPLVGRDTLVGALSGTAMGLLWHASYFAPIALGLATPFPFSNGLGDLNGVRRVVGDWFDCLASAIWFALLALFLLTLFRIMLVRRDRLAISALLLTHVVFNLWWCSGRNFALEVSFLTLIFAIFVLTLVRFGLLAVATAALFLHGLRELPLTLDLGAWYAGHALLALGLLALPALYGFHVSLAGRPAFGARLLED